MEAASQPQVLLLLALFKKMTLLSIIIPNYNYGHFIQDALDSIILSNQSTEFELIVIDDGSTDNSVKILKKYESESRITIYYHSNNLGAAERLNQGIACAQGSYLHFFASDDLYLPGSVDLILSMIKKYPHISLFCTDNCHFFSPQQIQSISLLPCKTFNFFNANQIETLFAHTDFWIPGHALFVKKGVYLKYGPLNHQLGPLCDWVINHQIALEHGVGYIPQSLVSMRQHAHSFSRNQNLQQRRKLWISLLKLCKEKRNLNKLGTLGLFRMLGLKSIYKDLLLNPFYWKYTLAILRKMVEKLCFKIVFLDRDQFWLNRLKVK